MPQEPNELDVVNPRGKVTYATEVVATIAGLAACEVAGVSGMSGGLVGGIIEVLGRKNMAKGIKVEIGSTHTTIDVYAVLDYGVHVPSVCKQVQEAVKTAVENMTALRCGDINVYVSGIAFEREQAAVEFVD